MLRGPLGHKYAFGPPILTFAEHCDVVGPSMELNMPGGGIHFAEGCGAVAWTGEILAANTFVSDSSSRHVQYAVRNPGSSPWSNYAPRDIKVGPPNALNSHRSLSHPFVLTNGCQPVICKQSPARTQGSLRVQAAHVRWGGVLDQAGQPRLRGERLHIGAQFSHDVDVCLSDMVFHIVLS